MSLQFLSVIVITPSVSMFIGQGLSLDARRAARAERRAANAAVVAPPAAERPSSAASPPPALLVLSPPGKLLTSRENRWISADDNDVSPPPRSTSPQGEGCRGQRRHAIRRPSQDRGRPLPFVHRGRRLWDRIGGPCRIVDRAPKGRGGTDSMEDRRGGGMKGWGRQ